MKTGYYMHFKGKVYLVLCTAKHTETEEELVVYYNFDGAWCRPLSMFTSTVQHNGEEVPRFKFIGETMKEAEEYLHSLPQEDE